MRITLSIDDDVLEAARLLARQRGTSPGAVISVLLRQFQAQPTGAGEVSPSERHSCLCFLGRSMADREPRPGPPTA